ncbi:methyltransferase domain-containing protein [Bordetella bronchialis]|uniref:Methyltransferase type 12 n=1 Tax=Bordetella bronchialis TaxID=463025 RepID=A0A193G3V2_9BORD|nr:methyltransferase domain-containing protein [Bordetella bronchialis]ANN69380.1 methyltransferase type 12 [Bordetella bronchialis]ANN74525.1 methyltransferase type 12 [Bordetella bronchialis]
MVTEQDEHSKYLGQFIPLQYHHVMLMDANRMKNFKAAIEHVVAPGARVLELGGGTGVLSWFAAARADKVWCVEFNRELVTEARRFLGMNANGGKVEVVHADAFEYLPPEPVDVMICEMVHVAMLREKQIEMVESFKQRYRKRFGPTLPTLVPTAVVMAVQPLQKEYDFEGFQAPIIQVEELGGNAPRTLDLAAPAVYSVLDYTLDNALDIAWDGTVAIEHGGVVNALRFITRNILALVMEKNSTIDWLNRYMSFPLRTPVSVQAGDTLRIRFRYRAGDFISVLMDALHVEVVRQA